MSASLRDAVSGNGNTNYGLLAANAFGNVLGNSIVRASQSDGTTTTNEQPGGGDRGPRCGSQGVGTTSGGNTSTGATNLNHEGSLERWNRLQASGELENLSDAEYYDLA
jgi:hypothetical protein